MANIPTKVTNRLSSALKRFQPVLETSKARDINEADTATIVSDMLAEVFGYAKYSEVTSEHAIRGTFCDLAVSMDGKVEILVEVKAIGLDPKDNHVKQAVDYAANKGVDWVVLTNGVNWRIYQVLFNKPIESDLVLEFDFVQLSHKSQDDLWKIFLLCREGWLRRQLETFYEPKQSLSRFCIGAIVMSDSVVDVARRELKRLGPDVKIHSDQVKKVLFHEILKRKVVEGEKADEAKKKISRVAAKSKRQRVAKNGGSKAETIFLAHNSLAAPLTLNYTALSQPDGWTAAAHCVRLGGNTMLNDYLAEMPVKIPYERKYGTSWGDMPNKL